MPASAATGNVIPKLVARCETVKPGRPGQAQLHHRDLADEAGDDDQGQRHQRADQRVDQRLAEAERQHDQRDGGHAGADHRGAGQVLRPRYLGQPPLQELAAARDARPAPEQHADDDEEREQVVDAGQRDPAGLREPGLDRGVLEQRVQDADAEAAAHATPNELKVAISAAASAGMICSGSVSGSSSVIDAARMPSAPASRAASERVGQRDRVRRQAAEHGRDLVLRGRPRRQPEPGPPVDRGEHGRRHDHQAGEDEPVDRDDAAEQLDGVLRQDAGSSAGVVPKASSIAACASSSTPSEATSFASGAEFRSGRNTTSSMTTPTTPRTQAEHEGAPGGQGPIRPVLSDQ